MFSLRVIILLLLAWIIWGFAKRWYRNYLESQNEPVQPPTEHFVKQGVMVRCHHCGLYLPKEEAIPSGEIYYCCKAHQQQTPPS